MEQTVVTFELFGHEADEIAHTVEGHSFEPGGNFSLVVDVGYDGVDVVRDFVCVCATIDEVELETAVSCELAGDGTADGACAADEEDFHKDCIFSI